MSAATRIYVNGRLVDAGKATVSVFDHGVLYGDGIFEGIRAYNGRVFKLERHLDRLYASARAILLTIPMTPAELAAAVLHTCAENALVDGYIRLVVTRGAGDLGLDPRKCTGGPSVIIIAQPGVALYEGPTRDGIAAITSTYRRVSPDALSPSIKTLNYLNNVMARLEASQRGAAEAIMLDHAGYVSEATADNVFIARGGTLMSPWTSTNLAGITRETIFELAAALGIPVVERPFTQYDMWVSDEAFVCGTGAEIVPIVTLDGRTIGSGRPGPLTARIVSAYHRHVREHGTEIPRAERIALSPAQS
jgi:branched-chain amino acid aminotransferase